MNTPVGIISGASPVWACKPRDDFFGINKDNRVKMLGGIINNVVFRLEVTEKNLASHILSVWRKQIIDDWKKKYGFDIFGFETFVCGNSRTGASYKADNWVFCGYTKGSAKRQPRGVGRCSERSGTSVKMVFCRLVDSKCVS